MKDYQEKSKVTAKTSGLRTLVGSVVAAAIAMVLLTGCTADNKNQPAEMPGTQIQEETQWVSKYGIPEEMRRIEDTIDREGLEGWEDVLELVTRDFGETIAVYEFEEGICFEKYADGYAKIYLFPALTEQLPVDGERCYSLDFMDTNGDCVYSMGHSESDGRYGYAGDEITYVMQKDNDIVVEYTNQYWAEEQEIAAVEIWDWTSGNQELVMTLTRDVTETVTEPTEEATEATEAPTEAPTEASSPAMTTKILDLGGCSLQEVSAELGDYSESNGFYWFDGGYVGYVYAYGTDRGNNYIQAPLNRLITDCPDALSVAQLQEYFPGGYTFYDEMDGRNCFAWDYRGCTVVIFEDYGGGYSADSLFYYNCNSLAQKSPQSPKVDVSVNEEVFQILGKTESQIADILGSESGGYDFEFGCWVYPYQDSYVSVYMDSDGTCLGFNTNIQNVVNMSAAVSAEELKNLFGSTYNDPWNGETSYNTVYKGGRLCIYQSYDEIGYFGTDSVVNFFLEGKVAFPDLEPVWNNSNSLFYGGVEVHSQTASELVCSMEYYQLTPPNRIAETGRITLTSTDGVTYTAYGVVDNWGSELNITVTMLPCAAEVTFDYTKTGEMANFCFGDFIAYK